MSRTPAGFGPANAYYLANHRGHLMFVRPDERPFITAEMIKGTSFTGTERESKQRVARAGRRRVRAGRQSPSRPARSTMIEDWGRIRRAFR
jgi:5,10-methylenetetrahydromethanopterin reductase